MLHRPTRKIHEREVAKLQRFDHIEVVTDSGSRYHFHISDPGERVAIGTGGNTLFPEPTEVVLPPVIKKGEQIRMRGGRHALRTSPVQHLYLNGRRQF